MDKEQQPLMDDGWHMAHAEAEQVLDDLAFYRTLIANVIFIGKKDTENWVLIDCGVNHYSKRIIEAAEKRFGTHPPKAIILTHGHFDHIGSAKELAKHWNVPIYAHPLEMPFITGEKSYPVANSAIGGGMFSLLSPFFPRDPINLSKWVQPLPKDGSVPHLKEWRIVHTPGHTPGHVSLFRDHDRTLVAGDAVITVKQESSMAVFIQSQHIHGPPAYFTHDWHAAEQSAKKIARLNPKTILSGHGLPMEGELMQEQLTQLAMNFKDYAIPVHQDKPH
ncbi:MBL fold metallo-hydrolase [Halobacillus shinanisalinarum]|uniref:MBL fold metallo-hydrolase n=1 Tax=Halobacillus shinanisalinarum TaxID=2932258 RepID=A0ABY4GX19_9BACI|nr:MBL fold metallo-hydrolase [Halobacillus shinanisalinarum]UOQ92711.1 MBL fold metallo-hydrolase [Halobacillus shinanisalinarum]